MKVEYNVTHRDDDKPCEKIIAIPEGFERCDGAERGGFAAMHEMERWSPCTPGTEYLPGVVFIRRKRHKDEPFPLDAAVEATLASACKNQYGGRLLSEHSYKMLCESLAHYRRSKRHAITLEAFGWYGIEGVGGIYQATLTRFGRLLEINGHLYDPLGLPDARCSASPRILKRVYVSDTPPLAESPATQPQPFRVSGPGWYKTVAGHWVDLRGERLRYYDENGRGIGGANLTARATPEQERILEGL